MYFKYDEKALTHLQKADAHMGEIIKKIGFIKRDLNPSLIEAVLHHIIGQQISSKALDTVWNRLKAKMQERKLDYLDLDEESLLSCGIPLRKVRWMLSFLYKIRNGEFDVEKLKHMDNEMATAYLSSLDGIGKWTAQMILLFCLNRMDIFSKDDLGIRRGIRMLYQRKDLAQDFLQELARRYSPYGSVACIYLWAVSGGAIEGLKDPALHIALHTDLHTEASSAKVPKNKKFTQKNSQSRPLKRAAEVEYVEQNILYNKELSLKIYTSPVGEIIIAVKNAKLITLRFIDSQCAQQIVAYSAERILNVDDTQAFTKVCAWLDDYFVGKDSTLTVQLQTFGTDFQKAIWELVRKIPYGSVVSYRDLAKQYCDQHKVARMSAQAIGRAVSCNPIALIIPCHRVIGANGSLTGYAYGIEKKQFLLTLEKKHAQ